jgi:hypothetical protein
MASLDFSSSDEEMLRSFAARRQKTTCATALVALGGVGYGSFTGIRWAG